MCRPRSYIESGHVDACPPAADYRRLTGARRARQGKDHDVRVIDELHGGIGIKLTEEGVVPQNSRMEFRLRWFQVGESRRVKFSSPAAQGPLDRLIRAT